MTRPSQGAIIGRFMPPHNGHRFLVDFAASYADEVTVFLCTLEGEPIPGKLRAQWMRDLFPGVRLVHITQEIPDANRHNPESPRIWARALKPHLPSGLDFLFASEDYGQALAEEFGARYVAVDPGRNRISVSASLIRQDPMKHWSHIPDPVRPYFLRRVVVAAGRNSQKICDFLAGYFHTLSASLPPDADPQHARAQISALSKQAKRLLFLPLELAQLAELDPQGLSYLASPDCGLDMDARIIPFADPLDDAALEALRILLLAESP